MHKVKLTIPIFIPEQLYRILRSLKPKKVTTCDEKSLAQNLLGDRDIEWSWIASKIPPGEGEVLDFGNGGSLLGLIAAQQGHNVLAIDLCSVKWLYEHPRLHFKQGDLLKLALPEKNYDYVINCSTVEHVGLVGRYGVYEDSPDGDLAAMKRLMRLMKPGGYMLLTIPIGKDAVFKPMTRIYGVERLPVLLDGYEIQQEEYWVKDNQNRWILEEKDRVLNIEASVMSWDFKCNIYSLGCFVLRRPVARE
ncbi:class I SAM-dependent methyltransferase [candidate division CSSED10-310 bacterium]|uniref:Class I SAM-dependent methyltransferase n=1 Tax=candidate division CSSED10-310 bacterium TaxID=2855610 RepID=A0ABV6Z0A5_UNCC1